MIILKWETKFNNKMKKLSRVMGIKKLEKWMIYDFWI